MDKNQIKDVLAKVKASSQKRKFKQSVDLVVTFKNLDLKKPDNHVDQYVQLHFSQGKNIKVCGLVGPELIESAKKDLDFALTVDDFAAYQKDKKLIKKLANEYDYFIAQANIMPKIAQTFGRVFGPRNKMPNPKAGCVVPPNANLKSIKDRLQKTSRILIRTRPMYQAIVGKEDQSDEEIIDNIMSLYNALIHALPNEEQNVKKVFLKLTMSPAVVVGATEAENGEA